jgi:hypothetical protein
MAAPKKKKKKMTFAEADKLFQKLGLPPLLPKRITLATVRAELKRKARVLPLAQRQLVLDLFRKGLTLREVAEQARVTVEEAQGVLELNIYTVKMLRTESL